MRGRDLVFLVAYMVARVVQAECHASGTFERQQAQGRRRPPCAVFWRCTAYSTVQRCKPCSSRVLFRRTRSGPCCVLQWQVNLFCTLPGSFVDPIRSLIVLPLVWFVITVRGVCLWRSSRGPLQYRTVHASSGVQHGPFPVHCMHIECVAGVMLLGQIFQVLVLGCRRHFRPLQRRRRFAKAAPRFQRKRQQIVNFSFLIWVESEGRHFACVRENDRNKRKRRETEERERERET